MVYENISKARILIVDDVEFNRKTLSFILSDYEVIEATSEKDALDMVLSGDLFDLILLDVMMQEMDGYEVCKKLRRDERTKNIPVIFVTAKNQIKDETKGLNLGAVDYITKPYQPVIVKARVKIQLELKKEMDHLYDLMKERMTQIDSIMDEINASKQAKIKFLLNVSQEIFSPIHGVIKMTDNLLNTNLTKEQKEFAETAKNSADFLLSLVSNIKDISKLEAGEVDLIIDEFNIRDLIKSIAVMLNISAKEKGISFDYCIHSDVPCMIKSDSGKIKQILINIGGNAIKFTEKGEVFLRVCTEVNSKNKFSLRFEIIDTGIGIPKDRLDNLFSYFSQVDSSSTRKYGGAGMGLAISRRLVELLGGHIRIESELGEGSLLEFTILPIIN